MGSRTHTPWQSMAPFSALLLWIIVLLPRPVPAAERVALVVGNSAYESLAPLRNPRNDARAVGEAFGRLGFDVTTILDVGVASFEDALRQFRRRSDGAGMAVVFYSGHGVEAAGSNYLVPVDATPDMLRYADDGMVSLDDVLGAMTGSGVRVVILDACRDNPLAWERRRRGGARSITRVGEGLGRLDDHAFRDGETLVAYAAAAGTTAADGEGQHSPYTAALLQELEVEQDILSMFVAVRRRVLAATDRRQRPHEYHGLENEYFLSGPPSANATWPPTVPGPVVLAPREIAEFTAAAGQGDAEALRRLRQAADASNVHAQVALGALYDAGRGVSRDYARAAVWYLRAAERGDADAQYNLASMYHTGQGRPPDHGEAAVWYRRAAERGHAAAQFNLGILFFVGAGVAHDPVQAAAWYRRAAEQGYAPAQNNLGAMYVDGKGGRRDPAAGVSWYRKAAEQGYAPAHYNLGVSYRDGSGATADAVSAHMWLSLAARNGERRAGAARVAVERRMTRAQLRRSDRRATTCRRSGYKDCGYPPAGRHRADGLPFGVGPLTVPRDGR